MATTPPAPATAEGPTSHTQNQALPSVYHLMSLVMRDVKNVGKDGFNEHQKYKFRGVDGAIGALAQPLRDHGVFMTPEVLDCESEVRGKMNAVRMRVAFHFYGPAGDRVTAITMGEASDTADKASNKAMSAALKYALIHTFMIPVDATSLDDGDSDHPAGHRSPADGFMERLRKPHVWYNPDALRALHSEAKADGLLAAVVEGPGGPMPLGDLIVNRGAHLKAEADERAAKRAEEAAAVAAQITAEHGVTSTPAPPAPHPTAAPAATQQPSTDDPLGNVVEQVIRSWDNVDALAQVFVVATRQNLLLRPMQGPDGELYPVGELVGARINELKTPTSDRSAA